MNKRTLAEKSSPGYALYFNNTDTSLRFNDETFRLDHKTFQLLCYFIEHQNQVIERQTLIENLWQNQHASDASLCRLISVLRKILGVHGHKFIFTIHKTGYRFVIPAEVNFINAEPPQEHIVESQVSQTKPKPKLNLRMWIVGFTVTLLVGCLQWAIMPLTGFLENEYQGSNAQTSPALKRIAIIEFEQLTYQSDEKLFIEGLTTELLNIVTRINGLLVVDHQLEDPLTKQAASDQQTNVRYLLKGNVRAQNSQLRINAQLVDNTSGELVFSNIFQYDQQTNDYFTIQTDIARQVSAALRLNLQQQPESAKHYFSALTRLNPVGVEKLLKARSLIDSFRHDQIKMAIDNLETLNKTYPNTPEILGLLADAYAMNNQVSSFEEVYSQAVERDLALAALNLDKNNLDALTTLYYYYSNFVEHADAAEQKVRQIIHRHPDSAVGYGLHLDRQIRNNVSCRELQQAVETLPKSKVPPAHLKAVKLAVKHCQNHNQFNEETAKNRQLFGHIALDFKLNHDGYYQTLSNLVNSIPSPQLLSQLYCQQLMMGAHGAAEDTANRLSQSAKGYWQLGANNCAYLHNQNSNGYPSERFDFLAQAQNYNSRLPTVSALVKQLLQDQGDIDVSLLNDYLQKVPAFTIQSANRELVLGLVMLQFFSGNITQSYHSAIQLMDHLDQYERNYPDAYRFWSFARIHFAVAFYAGHFEKAAQILDSGFSPQEAYWLHDKSIMSVVLHPWKQHPFVKQYLQRIEADANRARTKFILH